MPDKSFFDAQSDQSRIKATIVEQYLHVWAKILIQYQRSEGMTPTVAYLDLFAGPGAYKDGSPSTPIKVLELAIASPDLAKHLVTIFNDADPASCEALQKSIDNLAGKDELKYAPQVTNYTVGQQLTAYFARLKMLPSLFFLDPWGYKGLSLALITAALKDFGSECVIYFNFNNINRFLEVPAVKERMEELFGPTGFAQLVQKVGGLCGKEREAVIIEQMKTALRNSGAQFVIEFRFLSDTGNRTSHYIIHACKHVKGHEEMKRQMRKQSTGAQGGTGTFEFCPAEEGQLRFDEPADYLVEQLMRDFAGRTLTAGEVYGEHHPNRPFIKPDYQEALKRLQADDRVTCERRGKPIRKNSMPDDVIVTFP